MRLPLQPIRRRRLYEGIVEQLEDLILSGALPPGGQLPSERELMATFDVGRTAVREALFTLERRGLVMLQSGERASVTAPTSRAVVGELATAVRFHMATATGVAEFQQARLLFETGLCALAARTASAADLADLRERLAANEAALGEAEAFVDTDIAFHFAIAAICRNSIFTALHQALTEWLRGQRVASLAVPDSPRAAYAAHCRILDAIAAHDPQRATHEMGVHLDQVASAVRQAGRTA